MSVIIARARDRRGLTQAELARLVGCDRTFISHIEAGRPMSLGIAGRIARALELTPEECAELLDLAAGAGVVVDEVAGG